MHNNMDLMQNCILTVICGCMFAGKTEELIRKINVLRRAKKKVAVFLPRLGQRYVNNKIMSHNQRSIDTHVISTPAEMHAILAKQEYDAVCFDEVQFFPVIFFSHILNLVKNHKVVICAGLDKDYYDEYVGLMAKLIVRADVVYKLSAICAKCNGIATRTQRINPKTHQPINTYQPKIMIGGECQYEARCNGCVVEFFQESQLKNPNFIGNI